MISSTQKGRVLKAQAIETEPDNPFAFDAAGGREDLARSLTQLLLKVPTPYVLAINSSLGNGENYVSQHVG
jgi:hypothetical protein